MDAWTFFLVVDGALSEKVVEGLVNGALMQTSGLLVDKECRVWGAWSDL